MEVRRLRYFVSIAEAGSMSRAAALLGIAQPALSRQVQLLEQEVGVSLFRRSRTGMQVTEEGKILRAAVKGPLRQLEMAVEEVRQHMAALDCSIVFGIPSIATPILALPLVTSVAERLPNIKFRVVEDQPNNLLDQLAKAEIDMMVNYGPSPDDRFFDSDLLVENMVLVGARGSGLAGMDTIEFRGLDRYPLILPSRSRGIRTIVNKCAAKYEYKIDIALEIDSLGLVKDLVRTGRSFTILPASAIGPEIAGRELEVTRIVEPTLPLYMTCVSRGHYEAARNIIPKVGGIVREEVARLVAAGEWGGELLFTP